MKELSIEEKAKLYDEAIKIAKSKIKNDNDHVLYESDIIEIFHEFKENEDERIKRAIIATIHLYYGEPLDDEAKEMIAWVNKQNDKDEEILVLKDQIESLHAAIKALKEVHKIELEKRGEQNPAWSEEDEINLEKAIWYVENPAPMIIKDSMLVNWLKSLKYRVQSK